MSWTMQVRVGEEWRDVRPTNAEAPYRFTTKDAAERMLRTCYPDQVRERRLGASEDEAGVRVAESAEEANYDVEEE